MNRSLFGLGPIEIALQGVFWGSFWGNLIQGALAAVILSSLSWLFVRTIRGIRQLLRARGAYRITGIWIGTCELPRYRGDKAIEIYRLVTKKEQVTISVFHYPPNGEKIQKYEGAGIYRGNLISAFYYIPEPNSLESGVFVIKQEAEKFIGHYSQYDPKANMEFLSNKDEDFVLTRVPKFDFWPQIKMTLKMMWGRPPYTDYAQAKLLHDSVCSGQAKVLPKTDNNVTV
jgi:hypothetical protein